MRSLGSLRSTSSSLLMILIDSSSCELRNLYFSFVPIANWCLGEMVLNQRTLNDVIC